MNTKGWIMLRVLLNRYHKGSIETLLQPLPEEDIHKILSVNIDSTSIHPVMADTSERLGAIHFSWFADVLKSFPSPLQPYALSALSKEQQEGLQSLFKPVPIQSKNSGLMGRFFRHVICQKMGLEDILPLEYTPSEKLKILTELPKTKLLELIDLLGVYDLVPEIRQMISRKKINTIFRALPSHCQRFLRQVIYQQDKIAPLPLDLEKWNGESSILYKRVHRSGLRRFALSLSGSDPTILWHLLHRLDTGRCGYMSKFYTQEPQQGINDAALVQVLMLLEFQRKEEMAG